MPTGRHGRLWALILLPVALEQGPGLPASQGLNAGLDVYGFRANETPVVAEP